MIYALEDASAAERQVVEAVISDGNYEQVPFMHILQILERHDSIERAYDRARAFTEKSRSMIVDFPDSPSQRALQAIVELVTDRSS
jgi:octaprenyl-diphosphate synthase